MDPMILIESFLNDDHNRFSENTKKSYRTNLRQLFKHFSKDIEDYEEADIKLFKMQMLEIGRSPKTINQKLNTLKSFVNYLNKNATPLDLKTKIEFRIDLLTIQEQQFIDDLMTKSDFNRIVRAAEKENDYRAVALFYFLYLTGARISEALQLTALDVGKETKFISGKGDKFRALLIPPTLNMHLEAYVIRRGHNPHDPLFLNTNNKKSIDRIRAYKIIKYYAGKARVKLEKAKPHNFRHLLGFTLAAQGVPIQRIAEILGHSDINTSKIYTMTTKERLLMIVEDAA